MQLVINLFGGPGSSKSTTAAYFYAKLKEKGFNVELVREYAKDLVWSKNFSMLKNQELVTSTQAMRQNTLYGKVDAIITDSPILIGVAYDTRPSTQKKREWVSSVVDEFHRYDNINIFLKRNEKHRFAQAGRVENHKEALEKDKKILYLINKWAKEGHVKLSCKELEKMWDSMKVLLITEIMKRKGGL